jgi:hypothetical protein
MWRSRHNRYIAENQRTRLAHLANCVDWPQKAFPGAGSPGGMIVQRDDGMWSIGWHDEAVGPFPSYMFAAAIAAKELQRSMGVLQ